MLGSGSGSGSGIGARSTLSQQAPTAPLDTSRPSKRPEQQQSGECLNVDDADI
jgi:hypothetical protein